MKSHEKKARVRCAIYTRKSTEEGLGQAFNTLDAQREAAEAYIKSQQHEGWRCLPHRYDDGGFSGGTMDRPAFKKLIRDIQAGKIDCVVVYKVDRLSRSIVDFGRTMEEFEKHGCVFVSVTEQFNTKTPVGRMTLNLMATFAQYERELIAERTSDKMGAARRKGKWVGGMPPLGYDVHPDGGRIVINAEEAEHVRGIFDLYLEKESLLEVVHELDGRGWRTKRWTTKKGHARGGNAFEKNTISYLLTNPTYVGKVAFKGKVYDGEHDAIVEPGVWRRAQTLLRRNRRSGGRASRNKHGALLRGLLRCTACDVPMGHTYTQKGERRYRYYTCQNKQKRGAEACPTGSIPAGEIERFVVERIRSIGSDPTVQAEVLAQLGTENDHTVVVEALERFELAWEGLSPTRQTRMISLLVERIGYNVAEGSLAMTFRPIGIVALTQKGAA